jgi:basic membrane lipoprotein Med (substrate-binding protein (PBP1-ABC) superfamily)
VAVDKAGRPIPPPRNLAALRFREEEGSYLVGALAALVGHSKTVGFVGGMDSPIIQKFEVGYEAGVHRVCPDCTVLAQYAGVTPEAFRNPGKGKEIALAQYQRGANVIFHASGSTGLGVLEAARQTNKLAIGVDADQYSEAPGYVLTSMVKGVDNAVYDTIRRVKDGRFTGGIHEYGLAEQGVGYVYDRNNATLIPPDVHAKLEALRRDIVAGRIVVPSTRMSVDLPAPFSPTSAWISPRATSSDAPRFAWTGPNDFSMSCSRIAVDTSACSAPRCDRRRCRVAAPRASRARPAGSASRCCDRTRSRLPAQRVRTEGCRR